MGSFLSRLSPTRFAGAFAGDRRGVSALEFALIAPIMILFYFACVEISLMLTVDRKVTNIASAVGDLVAQDDEVDANEVDDIFAAARAIMEPYDSSSLQMRVSSVTMDAGGDVTVAWSRGRGKAPLGCGSTVTAPAGILAPGQSVVMAEVSLQYLSPIGAFLDNSYTLDDTFYLRPRRSVEVDFTPNPCP